MDYLWARHGSFSCNLVIERPNPIQIIVTEYSADNKKRLSLQVSRLTDWSSLLLVQTRYCQLLFGLFSGPCFIRSEEMMTKIYLVNCQSRYPLWEQFIHVRIMIQNIMYIFTCDAYWTSNSTPIRSSITLYQIVDLSNDS